MSRAARSIGTRRSTRHESMKPIAEVQNRGTSKDLSEYFILTFDEGAADEVWRYSGNSTLGVSRACTCFERLPGRRLLRRFPDERMKLLEASVAPGQRISLN